MSKFGTHISESPLEGYPYSPSSPKENTCRQANLSEIVEKTGENLAEIEVVLRGIIGEITGPRPMEEDSNRSVSCLNDRVMSNLDKAQTINRLAYQLSQLIS